MIQSDISDSDDGTLPCMLQQYEAQELRTQNTEHLAVTISYLNFNHRFNYSLLFNYLTSN